MQNPKHEEIFGWSQAGVGLKVNHANQGMFQHEVMFEDEVTHVRDQRVYVGADLPRIRYWFALVVVGLAVCGLVFRAFWMQVVQGAGYQQRAEQNRLRTDIVSAKRGIIRDRNGVILAENVPSFDLQVIPWLLPKAPEDRELLLGKIGREIGMDLASIEEAMKNTTDPTRAMTLMRDVPYERAIGVQILVGDNPAIYVVTGSKRHYPVSADVKSLSHLLGYVGSVSPAELREQPDVYHQTDVSGKTGIESAAEALLRGRPGKNEYEVDALNKVTSLEGQEPAVDGTDVTLTIDEPLQQAAETALRDELARTHLTRGTAIAMDPRNGSILALVSWPSYDNNVFAGSVSSTVYQALLQDSDRPLLPRAWAGVYPSGSTVKPVVAIAALMEHVISSRTTVNSVGGIKLGQTFFPDWKAGGHGITDVRKAIAWSVNSFFYTIGGGYESFVGLGLQRLTDWMHRFGLGAKTGLDVPGEGVGLVPSEEWKRKVKGENWYVGDTYNLSIGQGDLLVTPLQVANFTSVVANGGHLVKPHIAQSEMEAVSSTPIADASAVQIVRLGMRDTVTYGSGRSLSDLPIAIAGKTGTAQWRSDKANHAWFTSFAPFDTPQIVVTVMIEEGGEGSSTAIPVARAIYSAWLKEQRLGISLDKRNGRE